jgi:hypothetical protein
MVARRREEGHMRIRLEPSDEYMHELESAETFNESMYFNVYDPKVDLGGWFRLGNRANEGYAEMTCCLYLPAVPGGPDKTVGFMYGRPHIENNDAFDAGGMRFEVVEPFKDLRVTYEGKVARLTDPLVMKDPRKAFTEAEHVECTVSLDYRGVSPMMGGEPEYDEGEERGEEGFARGHYEQHVGARGRIECGADAWDIDGYGLRDHSWGPRTWQAPYWYRWLTCNAGETDGFMVSVIANREGKVRRAGVLFENGGYTPIVDAQISTTWSDDYDQQKLRCIATAPGGREIEISGSVMSFIPLRNRREGMVTRIGEGLTEYVWEGKTGYGLSEYLDQIEDDRPVGVDS